MNDEELNVFNRNIQLDLPRGWTEEVTPETPNQALRWEAVTLFVVGSVLLFLISRYGTDFRDLLFNITQEMPSAGDMYHGLAESMRALGRAAIFREEIATYAQTLLNDPETAGRVENGLRAVNEMRRVAR